MARFQAMADVLEVEVEQGVTETVRVCYILDTATNQRTEDLTVDALYKDAYKHWNKSGIGMAESHALQVARELNLVHEDLAFVDVENFSYPSPVVDTYRLEE